LKHLFKTGDLKTYTRKVAEQDAATFDSGSVHPVYATFALARDAEWAGRLFVLEMKEADEEGIGTYINVTHHSPALIGEEVVIESCIKSLERNQIICTFEARCHGRLIADGEQGQKILKKEKLELIFAGIKGT